MIYKIDFFGMCFMLSVKSKIENIDDESDIENYKFYTKIENMKSELDKVNEENRELWSIILNKYVNSSGLYGM